MHAKVVAITQSLVEGITTPEEFIAYCARVSNPSNQMNNATSEKLIRYLVQNGHWSPFDMVNVTMEIRTTRAIMAQVLRHWSFRFQEFSQRYANVEDFNLKDLEVRFAHEQGNRQGSSEVGDAPMGLSHDAQQYAMEGVYGYKELIRKGIAPESARFVLPLCTPTTAYMSGTVRSWMTYFWQRLDPHAQKEHRELAGQMLRAFAPQFPLIYNLICSGRPAYVEGSWISPEGQFSTGYQGEVLD